jgi:cytochrome c peroxidase
MGPPKKGLSEDMDSLANYVRSLNKIPDSPYKNADGTLTADAKQGEKLFLEKGCNDCHSGPFFTDAATNNLHDIGTLKPTSGHRLGGPLTGISTPTLQGLWMTAPYLHDGRAKTLQDAIKVMRNKANHEIYTTAHERDLLAAYLMQIDSHTPQPHAGNIEPSEPASNNSSGGGSLPLQNVLWLLIFICLRKIRFKHSSR